MISYEDIINEIWNLPDTSIIELDSKIPQIIRSKGLTEELEVANLSEKLSPGVKRDIEAKINHEIKTQGFSKFIFSESSDNRLIGSGNLDRYERLSRIVDHTTELVGECNKLNLAKDGEDVFKLTNIGLVGFTNMKRPVKSERDFQIFIGYMYKGFYDGAGGSNLRIPKKFTKITRDSQLVNIDDFVIFHIKHLRSLYEHDTELDENPDKKRRLIIQSCQKYASKPTLIDLTPKEFLDFQEKLLKDLNSFLEELKKSLIS